MWHGTAVLTLSWMHSIARVPSAPCLVSWDRRRSDIPKIIHLFFPLKASYLTGPALKLSQRLKCGGSCFCEMNSKWNRWTMYELDMSRKSVPYNIDKFCVEAGNAPRRLVRPSREVFLEKHVGEAFFEGSWKLASLPPFEYSFLEFIL